MRRLGLICAALAFLPGLYLEGSSAAYPYLELRPADQVIGGPTDGYLSALHYNPAGLRLFSGSQLLVVAGVRGDLGGYQRSAQLPAGFAPDQSAAQSPGETSIGWATSDMMIAGSWDLGTESVTVGAALYTPYNDETNYSFGDNQGQAAQHLSGRYYALADRTYSLWGTAAAALRLRPWLFIGAGFQFAYTHSRMSFMRDLDPSANDGLTCSGPGACEQWSQRQLIDLDVAGWGYGFTAGILAEPIDDRLWLGLSYISPLFNSTGAEVGLDGQPQTVLGQNIDPNQPCGPGGSGVTVQNGDEPAVCGAAHMIRSFPHLIYFGVRGHIELNQQQKQPLDDFGNEVAEPQKPTHRLLPWALELSGWMRVTVPPREALMMTLDQRVYPPGELTIALAQRPAVAVAMGVRELWPRLILAQELLYESPRTDQSAVSPANLEGHKLDLSLAARIRLRRRLWLLLTAGLTGMFFGSDAGSGFTSDWDAQCRASGYDVTTLACQKIEGGWGLPSAAGSYWLVIPHGSAGLEVNL